MPKLSGFRVTAGLKKNYPFSLLAFLLIICMALMAVCGQAKERKSTSEITITDSLGRNVTVPQPLDKMVVLNTDAAEAIALLGAQGKVVGVSEPSITQKVFLGMKDKQTVGKWDTPSYEKIAELNPQAVIAYGKWPGEDLEKKLEPLNIKVIRLDCYKPETFASDVKTLARMLDKEKRAEDFLKWREEKTKVLKERLNNAQPAEKMHVFAISSSKLMKGDWGTFAKGTATHQGIEMAGGVNVAGDLSEYPKVTAEWVLSQNPAALVVCCYGKELGYEANDYAAAEKVKEQALKSEILDKTDAVKHNRVYLLTNELLGGGKTSFGALYLAKWFYPDRFKDVNPEQVYREYFEKWLGAGYKGKHAYPLQE